MYNFSFESMYLEITSFCNRSCPYCYNDSDCTGDYLPKSVIAKLLAECKSKSIDYLTISGGEPFCHPEINEILEELARLHMRAMIISNLSTLSRERMKELLVAGYSIQATLDSCDAEKNDITRGQGSHQAVMELLSVAHEIGKINKIALRFNISKDNVSEIEEMIEFAIARGMPLLNLALLTRSGRGTNFAAVYDYNTDILDLARLMHRFVELQQAYEGRIRLRFPDLKEQVGCALYADGEISLSPKISPDGNVYFCQLFSGEENSLGNIKHQSLADVLNSEKAHGVAERVRKRKDMQKDCVGCQFTEFCMCGCPAVSVNQTGSLYEKDDQCAMIKFFMKEKIKQMCTML
ncbi:MAG: radical SAM protein [Clostridia bacterium]|nr:radical SAM protein [Clostridia bacterium]